MSRPLFSPHVVAVLVTATHDFARQKDVGVGDRLL